MMRYAARSSSRQIARLRKRAQFAGLVMPLLIPTAAYAQDKKVQDKRIEAAESADIVVTARQRNETLLNVPLAITAFTASEIRAAGLKDLGDIAKQTPGIVYNQHGSSFRAGRIDGVIKIRGVTAVSTPLDHLQPTSLFIDGVYVLGGASTQGLQDLERVEVIKGPQSAFFGRNTFAGAVNYITRSPSLTDAEGAATLSAATYSKYDFGIIGSAPLIKGKVALQLAGRLYHSGGEWISSDGGRLGQESTKSFNVVLYAKPVPAWKIKLRASYQEDEDGQPATGLIQGGVDIDTCSGKTFQRLDVNGNPITISPRRFICGYVPSINDPAFKGITAETSLRPALLAQNRNGFDTVTGRPLLGPQPDLITTRLLATAYVPGAPRLRHFGLLRRQIRLALNSSFQLANGSVASVTASYNKLNQNSLLDYDRSDTSSWYSTDPKYAVDWGVEGRISSPTAWPIRLMAGTTYYHQDFKTNGGGGLLISSCFGGAAANPCSAGPGVFAIAATGGNLARVWGVYGSASYDIFKSLTLDLEGRYMVDQRQVIVTGRDFKTKYKQITPRAIISFHPTAKTNLYVQYSKGILPGVTNGNLINCSPNSFATPYISTVSGKPSTASPCDQYRAQLAPGQFSTATPSQTLNSFEIGWKQSIGPLYFALTAWRSKWDNLPNVKAYQIFNPTVANGSTPQSFPNFLNVTIPGNERLYGVEFESHARVTPHFDLQLNASYSKSTFSNYFDTGETAYTGVTNLKGLQVPGYPAWKGNVALTYHDRLAGDWNWFTRSDISYDGDYWVDQANLERGHGYALVNLRMGAEREKLRIEFFIRNLLDDKTWATAFNFSNFAIQGNFNFTANSATTVIPQERRTIGVVTRVDF